MSIPSSQTSPLLKHICIIGPECTGKTTLTCSLANHYSTIWVPEYARDYLNKLNRAYNQSDLLKIAHGQIRMENEWIKEGNRLAFFDTNLLVIKIWSEHKFGQCEPEILKYHESRRYDFYLLTDIDLPWEEDPQREHPNLREHFKKLYAELIAATGIPYALISGDKESRLKESIQYIDALLAKSS